MISAEGIYTFIPSLSRTIYSYNFTEEQKIKTNQQNEIYQSQICQFSNENGSDEYVLCNVMNTIYVLDKTGKILFFEKLNYTISSTNTASLVCNKYDQDSQSYIFFIIIKSLNTNPSKLIINGYNLFFFDKNQGKIILFHNNTYSPTLGLDGYYITYGGISCKIMLNELSNVMVCFIPIITQNNKQPMVSLIFDSESFEISKADISEFDQVKHISSSVGDDKSKALVCYLNSAGENICYSYDINQHKFSENKIVEMSCKLEQTLMKTFYFSDSNEFIISCIDPVPKYNMKRIDHNFNLVQEDNFEKTSFNCDYFYSFSVVYVNKYKDYILIIYSRCNNYASGIRFFELSNKCDIGNIKGIDDWEEEKETNTLTQIKLNSDLFSNSSMVKEVLDKLSELNKEETIKESERKDNQEAKYSDKIKEANIETNKPKIIDSVYNDEKTQKEKKIISDYPEEEKKSDLKEIQLTEMHLKSDNNNEKTENLYYNDKSTNFLKFETNKKEELIKTDTTKEEINYSKFDFHESWNL